MSVCNILKVEFFLWGLRKVKKFIFMLLLFNLSIALVCEDNIYFSREQLHNFNTIMLIIDPDSGKIIDRSRGALKFYGYKEIIGMNINQLNTLSYNEILNEMQNAKVEKRNFFLFKHRLMNGNIRAVEVNSYPMQLGNKKILLSRIRDVTDALAHEQFNLMLLKIIIAATTFFISILIYLLFRLIRSKKLIKSYLEVITKEKEEITEKERLLDKVGEMTKVGGWELNPENNRFYCTKSVYQIFETESEKEQYFDTILNYYSNKSKEKYTGAIKELIEKGKKFDIEVEFITKEHKKKIVRILGNKKTDETGKIEKLFGTIQDITEYKELSCNLEQSENRFALYVENSPYGIFVSDREGNYVEVNRAAIETTGYSKEELLKMNLIQLIPDDLKEKDIKEFEKLKSTGSLNTEIPFITKSGERRFWSIKAIKLSEDRLIGFTQDISELRKVQSNLIQAKIEAEKANRAKSEFLSNMSHEIRTPMNAIISFIDILFDEEDDEEKREYLKIIKNSSNNLLSIINDILDLAKIESGKYNSIKSKVNLYHLMENSAKIYREYAKKSGIEFNFEFDNELNMDVAVDEKAVTQILNNLLSNAIKFTEKGEVKFSIKRKNLSEIEIIVQDTGIGMSKDKLDRIYEKFYQGEHFLNKKYGGTGLGLPIVKSLIELLDGEIFVETKEGYGTKFIIIIPVEQSEIVRIESEKLSDSKSRDLKLKIISAEDIEVNQKVFEKIFKDKDWSLKKVYNGAELLEELEKEQYDLILMDIQMPVMNGIEAAKAIRSSRKFDNIPIIGVSAYVFRDDVKKALDSGMNEYLFKPVNKDELIEKIEKVVIKREKK